MTRCVSTRVLESKKQPVYVYTPTDCGIDGPVVVATALELVVVIIVVLEEAVVCAEELMDEEDKIEPAAAAS